MEQKTEMLIEYLLERVMEELIEVFLYTPLYIPKKSIGFIEEKETFYFSIRKNKNSMRQDFFVNENTFDEDIEKVKTAIEDAFNIKIEKYIV